MLEKQMEEIIEHWDDLEVTVMFTTRFEYTVEFNSAEIVATQIVEGDFRADRGWTRRNGQSNLDLVYDPHDAERYISGSVKWDGCQNLYFGDRDGYMHICGPEGAQRMSQFLLRVFNRCGELMGDKVLKNTFPAKAV
jgi:hypothetical protein